MFASSRPILSSVELFGRTLRNRLAVAPMSRVSATSDGLATERMATYYRESFRVRRSFVVIIWSEIFTVLAITLYTAMPYDHSQFVARGLLCVVCTDQESLVISGFLGKELLSEDRSDESGFQS